MARRLSSVPSSHVALSEAPGAVSRLAMFAGHGVGDRARIVSASVFLALLACVHAFAGGSVFRLGSVQLWLQAQLARPVSPAAAQSLALLIICCIWIVCVRLRAPGACCVLDVCCSTGINCYEASADNFGRFLRSWRSVKEEHMKFQFKVFAKSGVGMEAYAPARLFERGEEVDMEDARLESEELIMDAAKKVLEKAGVAAREVDVVVVNSSLFSPVPSLAAVVVRGLKLRSNVRAFNLSGMGCSAGLVAIDLAARMLRVRRNCTALVLSTENITSNMYFGNDRSMMVSNCLFRCGCSAVLLSNFRAGSGRSPKMQLLRLARTNLAHDAEAFACVQHREDDAGRIGVSLSPSLVRVAGTAVRANITTLAPFILPWGELLKAIASIARKKLLKKRGPTYMPNFKATIAHFCIHPGGRAVVDEIGKGLNLSDYDVEPGRMALERFGNTSSSGIWFAWAYCEAKGRLKKGDKVMQIALGSGFKCNSAVWRVLCEVDAQGIADTNPWSSCIDQYPIAPAAVDMRSVWLNEFYVKLFGLKN